MEFSKTSTVTYETNIKCILKYQKNGILENKKKN